jgi:hypothetical protein
MKLRMVAWAVTALGAGLFVLPADAFEVPESPPIEYYQNIWQQSPFDRKVLPDTAPVRAEVDYVIQSTWRIGDVRYIAVYNRKDKSNLVISSDPEKSDDGGKLLSLSEGESINEMKAQIEVNGRKVDVRYDEQFIALKGPKVMAPNQGANKAGAKPSSTRRVIIPGRSNSSQKKPTVQRSRSRGIVLPGR